jgi:chromatin remodeling complex protein RSC6
MEYNDLKWEVIALLDAMDDFTGLSALSVCERLGKKLGREIGARSEMKVVKESILKWLNGAGSLKRLFNGPTDLRKKRKCPTRAEGEEGSGSDDDRARLQHIINPVKPKRRETSDIGKQMGTDNIKKQQKAKTAMNVTGMTEGQLTSRLKRETARVSAEKVKVEFLKMQLKKQKKTSKELQKRVKELEKTIEQISSKEKTELAKKIQKKSEQMEQMSGIYRPYKLSNELSAFTGKSLLTVGQTISAIHSYAKEQGLKNPDNRRIIRLDETLRKLFPDREEINQSELMTFIRKHLLPPTPAEIDAHREGVQEEETPLSVPARDTTAERSANGDGASDNDSDDGD